MYRRPEQMYPIIESYVRGEKSKQELCSANDLSIHVFQYWLGKYNRSSQKSPDQESFVPIEVNGEVSRSIRIKLSNGTEIEIPMA